MLVLGGCIILYYTLLMQDMSKQEDGKIDVTSQKKLLRAKRIGFIGVGMIFGAFFFSNEGYTYRLVLWYLTGCILSALSIVLSEMFLRDMKK